MEDGQRLLRRLHSAFQVAAVAVGGQLAAALATGLPDPERLAEQPTRLFLFLLADALFTLLLIGIFLRSGREGWRQIGWRRAKAAREALIGLLSVPLLLLAAYAVIQLFALYWPHWSGLENPLLDLIRGPAMLLLFLATSILVGGFKEEIQRAFVLERFRRDLGGVWVGLLLWSAFFGALHLLQGPDRATAAAVLGVLFGLLYLRKGHLAAPIAAHAVYDVVVVVLRYLDS
ncbi:MAG TPA: CPBP family intramembrane glutamic endopeptidase [Acidobacteriota bacterium]|nr:CPBP family intramembrane glutamic endopeptidase [Acidobacteriota bacterium]